MTIQRRGDSWWTVLSESEARQLINQSNAELCELHDNGESESVVDDPTVLEQLLSDNCEIGIFIGDVDEEEPNE